jgi:hypothetical protein
MPPVANRTRTLAAARDDAVFHDGTRHLGQLLACPSPARMIVLATAGDHEAAVMRSERLMAFRIVRILSLAFVAVILSGGHRVC